MRSCAWAGSTTIFAATRPRGRSGRAGSAGRSACAPAAREAATAILPIVAALGGGSLMSCREALRFFIPRGKLRLRKLCCAIHAAKCSTTSQRLSRGRRVRKEQLVQAAKVKRHQAELRPSAESVIWRQETPRSDRSAMGRNAGAACVQVLHRARTKVEARLLRHTCAFQAARQL